jgi:hypothetical protein
MVSVSANDVRLGDNSATAKPLAYEGLLEACSGKSETKNLKKEGDSTPP